VPSVDRAAIARALLVHEFDAVATCKLLGFPSVDAYYKAAASSNFIPSIHTPTLFVTSEDDPFLGELPVAQCRENEHTVLAVTAAGGHCAHLQGLWPLGASWADAVVMQFIDVVQHELHATPVVRH
jgi:predicted alpha/beta-fold hydrolase